MLKFLKKEANITVTENGARTFASTMDHCLDLFATAGGMRNASETEIENRVIRAYTENPDMAMKILFYARDVRGGLGERRLFRVALKYLCENHSDSVVKNIEWIAEFGRYDDLLVLMDTPCEKAAVTYMQKQLTKDMEACEKGEGEISLIAKWLPSVNTSNSNQVKLGRKLAKAFGMKEKDYRKTLAKLRRKIDIIENYLREEDYTFSYEKQPGNALLKYRKAFYNHDAERYGVFLDQVKNNEVTMHTSTLMPYEIIRPLYGGYYGVVKNVSDAERNALTVTWNAQPDYALNQNSLVVIDGSGSMYGFGDPKPAHVAQSLGLYFAEKNTGAFANHFITFSERPRLIEVQGKDLVEKLRYITTFNEVANTNVQAVFELILQTAVNNKIPKEQMPERIFFISDMEFDQCAKNSDMTNFQYAKKMFEKAGYQLPEIVFWNVASRKLQMPVTKNEQGVILVSGCNARVFEQVLSGSTDPRDFMLQTVSGKRYEKIVA